MGIDGVGWTMSGPASMADAAGANHVGIIQLGFQIADLALFLDHMLPIGTHDSHARAVITAVFQAFQSFQQNMGCVGSPRYTNYAAHKLFLLKSDWRILSIIR